VRGLPLIWHRWGLGSRFLGCTQISPKIRTNHQRGQRKRPHSF